MKNKVDRKYLKLHTYIKLYEEVIIQQIAQS